MTMSPADRVGTRACWTQARKLAPLIGPSKTQGAVIRSYVGAGRERPRQSAQVARWPSGSRRRDVRALLLGGVGCLFLRLSPPLPGHNAGPCSSSIPGLVAKDQQVRQSAQVARCAKWLAPPRRQGAPAIGGVGCLFLRLSPRARRKSPSVERFASIPSAASKTQSWGSIISIAGTVFVGFDRAPLLPTLHQLHNKADAHIKLLRRRIARGPRFNNSNNSFTKIFRIRSCHPWLASFNPAHSLNHFLRGIPFLILSMPDPL